MFKRYLLFAVPAFDVHMSAAELKTSSAISVASQQEGPPRYLQETCTVLTHANWQRVVTHRK